MANNNSMVIKIRGNTSFWLQIVRWYILSSRRTRSMPVPWWPRPWVQGHLNNDDSHRWHTRLWPKPFATSTRFSRLLRRFRVVFVEWRNEVEVRVGVTYIVDEAKVILHTCAESDFDDRKATGKTEPLTLHWKHSPAAVANFYDFTSGILMNVRVFFLVFLTRSM